MKYYTFDLSDKCTAITTTTELGNMAFQIGDNYSQVLKNRNEIAKCLNIDTKHIVFVHQHHSTIINKVTKSDLGKGELSFESGVDGDALYTKEKGIALGIFHADCTPIFIIDETIPLIGIIHAGHKGTLKQAAYLCLTKLINDEKLDTKNLKIYIGPLRRTPSYELTKEQEKEIVDAGLASDIENHHFNMAKANKEQILKAGILKENIFDSEIDTFIDEKCFSAFKKTPIGRMASLIILK